MVRTRQATILLVDDDENSLDLMESMLIAAGHEVVCAASGEAALASINEEIPDLVLLDVMMPGMGGFEVMRQLKSNPETHAIPIILITAQNDRDSRARGLKEGGAEFLTKPVERIELLLRVGNLLKMKAYQESIVNHNLALDEHIQWLAHFDSLTGLPNRALLEQRAGLVISMAHRNHTRFAVMFLDLDHFKSINDTMSHHIGDELLKSVSKALLSTVRKQDTVSRLSGDEFFLILPETDPDGAEALAKKILSVLTHQFMIEQYELEISASIGIAMYPKDGDNLETLSRHADAAMYRAKQNGRNNYCFFTEEMQLTSIRSHQLEQALRKAVKNNLMCLHYQPTISLKDGSITSVEALLRWKHEDLGPVPPAELIPIAESSGRISELEEWVMRTAIQQLKSWMKKGMRPIPLSLNLTSMQFLHPDLPTLISKILEETKVPNKYLELEVTEEVILMDPEGTIKMMNDLHKRGIQLAIDDFGKGYSSINYFKQLAINRLKIHESFIDHIIEDPKNQAIVLSIINMARSLGIKTTAAEGVETEKQMIFLRENGCDEAQGFYFCKPMTADEFEVFMQGK